MMLPLSLFLTMSGGVLAGWSLAMEREWSYIGGVILMGAGCLGVLRVILP